MADADATELQGDGKALGEQPEKEKKEDQKKRKTGRGREARGRRVFFLFFLLKKKKWDGYERSEGEGKRRGGTATAGPPRSTAAR